MPLHVLLAGISSLENPMNDWRHKKDRNDHVPGVDVNKCGNEQTCQ